MRILLPGDFVRWKGRDKGMACVRIYELAAPDHHHWWAVSQGVLGKIKITKKWHLLECSCGRGRHSESCWKPI